MDRCTALTAHLVHYEWVISCTLCPIPQRKYKLVHSVQNQFQTRQGSPEVTYLMSNTDEETNKAAQWHVLSPYVTRCGYVADWVHHMTESILRLWLSLIHT